jgi:hypothetical protein
MTTPRVSTTGRGRAPVVHIAAGCSSGRLDPRGRVSLANGRGSQGWDRSLATVEGGDRYASISRDHLAVFVHPGQM